jgi:20S proteasome subunit beta 1
MSCSEIGSTLDRNSTEKFFIEYKGFFSNHLAHGVVALHRLGVPNERIERFIKWYSPKLESTGSDVIDDRPFEELKGQRSAYYTILKHYENLLRKKYKTVDELIKNEYPDVSNGLCGSALHGTIHLGYGYSVQNERIILEGLAYTYHSYRPIVMTKSEEDLAAFGKGTVDITEALKSLHLKKDLSVNMEAAIKEDRWKPLKLGRFQLRVFYMLTDHGDFLTDMVLSLAFGPEVRTADGSLDPVKFGRRLVYLSMTVYALAANRNDFFLLHGVTCAWGLHMIMPLMSKENGIKTARDYLTVLLAVYVAVGSPELNVPLSENEFTDKDWTEHIAKTVEVDRDEHCYKLVQVCYEMAKDAREHGEDPKVYSQAAKSAIHHELYFYTG